MKKTLLLTLLGISSLVGVAHAVTETTTTLPPAARYVSPQEVENNIRAVEEAERNTRDLTPAEAKIRRESRRDYEERKQQIYDDQRRELELARERAYIERIRRPQPPAYYPYPPAPPVVVYPPAPAVPPAWQPGGARPDTPPYDPFLPPPSFR